MPLLKAEATLLALHTPLQLTERERRRDGGAGIEREAGSAPLRHLCAPAGPGTGLAAEKQEMSQLGEAGLAEGDAGFLVSGAVASERGERLEDATAETGLTQPRELNLEWTKQQKQTPGEGIRRNALPAFTWN